MKELETNSLNDRIAEEIENPTDYAGELEQIASPIELPKETLEFFNADELRARVFYEKYALKDMNGRVVEQTPVDMWARVARELASVEATEEKRSEWAKKFYWLLENFRFVPGGRIMFGAGQPRRSTLLNCLRGDTTVLVKRAVEVKNSVLGNNNAVSETTSIVNSVQTVMIKDIVGQEVDVLTPSGWSSVIFQNYGRQKLFKITLRNGDSMFATGNHEWVIRSNEMLVKKTTVELMSYKGDNGLVVSLPTRPIKDEKYYEGIVHGIIYGDGSKNGAKYCETYSVWLSGAQRDLAKYLPRVHEYSGEQQVRKGALFADGVRSNNDLKKLPSLSETSSYWYGFICGYLAADGWVHPSGNKSGLDSHNKDDLLIIKSQLPRIGLLGLDIRLVRKENPHNGLTSPLYRLCIWKGSLSGDLFLRADHLSKFQKSLGTKKQWTIGIDSIEETNLEEEVFCCNEPLTHTFTLGNGILTGNCYFLPVKSDSLEDIFDFCKEAGRTYSYGGGVGTDISILRPKGAPVNNSAVVSTGSVSFMELFSVTTGTIGQAGRRGALMITIHVDHPDVVDFIDVKRDLTRVNHANISVCLTDKFMHAVQNDENFTLAFKNEKADVKRVVKARELWDKLVRSAWESAEPGIIFWDNVKNESPTEYNGMEVHGFNPCVVGNTLVLTEAGWKRVDSLTEGERIITAYGTSKPISKVYVFESSDVYRVRFTDGGEVLATADHIFHTRSGRVSDKTGNKFWDKEKRLRDLKSGDLIRVPRVTCVPNNEIETRGLENRDFGFRIGVLLGDGCYTERVLANNGAKIATDFREKEWNEKIINTFRDISPRARLVSCSNGSDNAGYILLYKEGSRFIQESTLLGQVKSFEKEVPLEYINSNKEFHMGLIDGLFSTDGNIDLNKSNPVARLTSSSLKLLQNIRLILLFYGIHSKISDHTPRPYQFLGKTITPKRSGYNLCIYGHDLLKFASTFSLSYSAKQNALDQIRDMSNGAASDFTRIAKIEYIGKETVYDIFEKETDTWITEGYASRGCSEQCLEDYGCCCLGNINLSQFVVDEFSERARLDWRNLEKALRYATRFLDNVLDYNSDKHPLPQQTKASMWSRRIGVGFTGLADMLIKLNLKYDSAQSIKFIDRMFDRVKNICYDESCNIAAEKGPAPAFIAEKHLARPFIQRLDGNVKQKIAAQGVRNSCVLTVPPVGSGAIIAGTTSGIEPIFALSYVRKSKSLSGGEFKVFHPLVQDYMKRFGLRSESELPDIFVTAHSIKAEFRVQMQGTIQKHIDSSISSTVNIPKEATVQDVKDIYFQAWRAGCKGITVYREGAREGILLTNEEAANQKGSGSKAHKFERPTVLTGQTIKMKVPQGSLYVTANKNGDDIIRETFVTLGKSGGDEKADAEAIGRLISLYLQHGGKVNEVIQTLKGIQGRDVSWDNGQQLLSVPDAVAKALASLTGTTVEKEHEMKHCPDCGEASIIFENGCYRCSSCGYSKCN